jgi:hypothetical protein
MARANARLILCSLALLATACGDRATAPDALESSERAHLAAIEIHKRSGEIAPLYYQRYSCPTLECSVWVYVTSPGERTRTIVIDVPSTWILPPRTLSVPESQLASMTSVKIYEGAFDASQLQMADLMPLQVRLTETSAAWGTHVEEQTLEVSF